MGLILKQRLGYNGNCPGNLKDNREPIQALVDIVADLRGPDGCPWDKEQNHRTLARYAIEETFEMVEVLEEREASRDKTGTNSDSFISSFFKI